MPSRPSTIIRSPLSTSRHDPLDARDRRDAAAARQDRRVAGRAAELGDDPGDRQVAQAHRLAGQDLVRHQDHRLVAVARVAVPRSPPVDVADRLAASGASSIRRITSRMSVIRSRK